MIAANVVITVVRLPLLDASPLSMNVTPPRLKISTRDMVFAFLLAFVAAAVVGALANSRYQDLDRIALPIAQLVSVVVLILLVMLGGKQSISDVIAATSIGRKPRTGGVLLWFPTAIMAGLIFRFGTSGLAYVIVEAFHLVWPAAADTGLAQPPPDPDSAIDTMLVVGTLLGAAIEEFTYRRILQSFFCRRYGLWAGMIGVAVVFGAVHTSVVIMLAGFCLALLYVYSGRLWVSILAHFTGNLAIPVMASLQLEQGALLVACIMSAALLVPAVVFAVAAIRRSPPFHG